MKNNRTFKQGLIESIACTIVAASIIACGHEIDRHHGKPSPSPTPTPTASASAQLVSGARPSTHITQPGKTLIASLFSGYAVAPGALSQSFDAVCNMQLDLSTVPQGSFIPVSISRAGLTDCNSFNSVIQGGGKRIHDPGTLGNLVVDVTLDDNSELTCEDKTDAPAVADLDVVQAYYTPDTGRTLIANGATATTLACSVTVPLGRKVVAIEAQWTK